MARCKYIDMSSRLLSSGQTHVELDPIAAPISRLCRAPRALHPRVWRATVRFGCHGAFETDRPRALKVDQGWKPWEKSLGVGGELLNLAAIHP